MLPIKLNAFTEDFCAAAKASPDSKEAYAALGIITIAAMKNPRPEDMPVLRSIAATFVDLPNINQEEK